jgi:tape measure domain-containing protein
MAENVEVLLRLRGSRQFVAQATAAAMGVEKIGDEAEVAGRKTDKASKSQSKFSSAMGKLKGVASTGAAALGLAAGAAAAMGIKYNISMEQTRMAMKQFLGSTQATDAMIAKLQALNKKTPFEFPEIAATTRRLLAMGFNANEAYTATQKLTDAVAAMGGGQAELERVSTTLGQIRAKGRLQAEELMQLNEAGVTSYQSLAGAMGITVDQLQEKMKKGQLDATTAIDAIMGDWTKRFGGAAAAQSKTFAGMISNLKDSFSMLMGEAMQPMFVMLRDQVLPALNDAMPAIKVLATVIGVTLAGALLAVIQTLGFMSQNWVDIAVVVGGAAVAYVALNAAMLVTKTVTLAVSAATKAYAAAQWLLNIAMRANPIGLIITAITAVVVGLVLAYRHSDRFKKIIVSIWGWIKTHWKQLAVLIGGPIGLAAVMVISHFKEIKAAGKSVVDWLVNAFHTVMGWIGKVGQGIKKVTGSKAFGILAKANPVNVGKSIAGHMANGGPVTRTGAYVVGERGPEVVSLRGGSTVYPTPSLAGVGAPSLEPRAAQNIVTKVYLDKRQIAEAVGSYVSDKKARR